MKKSFRVFITDMGELVYWASMSKGDKEMYKKMYISLEYGDIEEIEKFEKNYIKLKSSRAKKPCILKFLNGKTVNFTSKKNACIYLIENNLIDRKKSFIDEALKKHGFLKINDYILEIVKGE